MPNIRSFLIAASLVLVTTLSSSAFAQVSFTDDPSQLELVDPRLLTHESLNQLDPMTFLVLQEAYAGKIQRMFETYQSRCETGVANPASVHACSLYLERIQTETQQLDDASTYWNMVVKPQKLWQIREAPSLAPTTDPPPPAVVAAPSAPGEKTHTLAIPNVANFTTEYLTIEALLGSRDEFVVTCSGDRNVWEAAYDTALTLNKGALEMPARAPTMIRWATVSTENPDLTQALSDSVRRVTEVSEALQSTQATAQAPRSTLERYRALGDFGPNSCGELYDFAFETDARHTLISMAVSDVAMVSTLIVNEHDGREAADEHWEQLNRFVNGWLLGPTRRATPAS